MHLYAAAFFVIKLRLRRICARRIFCLLTREEIFINTKDKEKKEKEPKLKTSPKFKLKQYIRHYLPKYFIAIAVLLASVILDMLSPKISQYMVDDVILGHDMEIFKKCLIALGVIGVGRFIFQYVKEYTFDWVSVNIVQRLRHDLFVHVNSLDTEYFDKNNTGEIMARIKDDIDTIWDALSYVTMLLIEVFVHTGIIMYFMLKLSVKLTIIPTIAMIICAVLAVFLEHHLDKIYDLISDERATLNTTCEENIGGVRTVKAFAREKFEIEKFDKHNDKFCEYSIAETKTFVKYYPYFQFITRVLPFMVLAFGGLEYINGSLTLGEVTAFVAYSQNIVWPMEMLGWLTNSFSSAFASFKKVNKIYHEASKINESETPILLPEVKGHITFNDVSFHKADEFEILKHISFDLPAGKTLGIMGATGSGKTSVVSLLTRLYDTTDGEVLLDGVNIKDMSLKQLRGNIALIMQDVFLFSDTISENIKMGNKDDVSDDKVRTSAKLAMASEFVEKMDKSYDTVIGERGVGLSGGQKQRISIARAFSKDLPILIMDDSTSALDMETERDIQHTLEGFKDVTKIIIAHRISAVKKADEIIVLNEGAVAERGTHTELLKKKGLYYETYVSQHGEPDWDALCEVRKEA